MVVLGTGTEVGKTWVSVRLLQDLARQVTVAAKKPVQSFEPGDDPAGTDASLLAGACSLPVDQVCPPWRSYPLAMAPPMAAAALGRPGFTLAELLDELAWPTIGDRPADVGVVETAGGARSPLADDGDSLDLAAALRADRVVVVADAGLGTINAVRLVRDAVALRHPGLTPRLVVVLNRYRPADPLHRANRRHLAETDGLTVVVTPGEETTLSSLIRDLPPTGRG